MFCTDCGNLCANGNKTITDNESTTRKVWARVCTLDPENHRALQPDGSFYNYGHL